MYLNHKHQTIHVTTTCTHAGAWAEQAMGNLQKIIKAVSSPDEASEEGGPARKRACIRVCEQQQCIATSLCIFVYQHPSVGTKSVWAKWTLYM